MTTEHKKALDWWLLLSRAEQISYEDKANISHNVEPTEIQVYYMYKAYYRHINTNDIVVCKAKFEQGITYGKQYKILYSYISGNVDIVNDDNIRKGYYASYFRHLYEHRDDIINQILK